MVDPKSVELLISRLAHDLASPLGAVANGLELMAEEDNPAIQEEAIGLSQRSAKRAADLVGLFRMAYGSAGKSTSFTAKNALQLAGEWLAGSRVGLQAGEEIPDGEARLLLQMIIIASETMPRGGRLLPARGPSLIMEGQRGGTFEDLRKILHGEAVEYTTRTIPIRFALEEAKSMGQMLLLTEESDQRALLRTAARA